MANALMVIVGIGIICGIYMFPIHTVSVPSFFGTAPYQYSLTIANMASLCSSWIIGVVGGSECSFYQGLFYLGWIVGGGMTLMGIFGR